MSRWGVVSRTRSVLMVVAVAVGGAGVIGLVLALVLIHISEKPAKNLLAGEKVICNATVDEGCAQRAQDAMRAEGWGTGVWRTIAWIPSAEMPAYDGKVVVHEPATLVLGALLGDRPGYVEELLASRDDRVTVGLSSDPPYRPAAPGVPNSIFTSVGTGTGPVHQPRINPNFHRFEISEAAYQGAFVTTVAWNAGRWDFFFLQASSPSAYVPRHEMLRMAAKVRYLPAVASPTPTAR